MSSEIAIKVENISKCYQIYDKPRDRLKQFVMPRLQGMIGHKPHKYYREFWALKDVSFEIKKGETVGIIGRNGSGKSTLLQMICGTLNPTSGGIQTHGRIAALLELGSGFNPDFTGRENVYMNAAVLGLSADEIDRRFDEIAAFSDIGDFIEQPVKAYSSGMMVRLAFAVAINVAPDILVVDEALAVGDAAFQRKCMRKINELSDGGVTLLFVSHDTETVRKICSQALYLNRGAMLEIGSAKDVCVSYERDLFAGSKDMDFVIEAKEAPDGSRDFGSFDQEFLKTSEKVYGDGRVTIDCVAITNKNGKNVNVLEPGCELTVSYRAMFAGFSIRPIFGMMITTREGVCIFGANTDSQYLSSRNFTEGEEVTVNFHLCNNLGPGIYYLTCGVHSTDDGGDLVYLHRRMDALIFKCVMRNDCHVGGVANLYPRISFDIKVMGNEEK